PVAAEATVAFVALAAGPALGARLSQCLETSAPGDIEIRNTCDFWVRAEIQYAAGPVTYTFESKTSRQGRFSSEPYRLVRQLVYNPPNSTADAARVRLR